MMKRLFLAVVALMTVMTAARAQFVIEKTDGSKVQTADVSFNDDGYGTWVIGSTGLTLGEVKEIRSEVVGFDSGDGTEDSPFIIKTVQQLQWLSMVVNAQNAGRLKSDTDYTKAYYKLGNDIDMSGVSTWTPIGTGAGNANIEVPDTNLFCGSIDGGGYAIKNMKVKFAAQADTLVLAGLVGVASSDCVIKNLSVSGSYEVSGDISGSDVIIGGLCAVSFGATITASSFEGGISSSSESDILSSVTMGGLVGLQLKGGVTDCNVTLPAGSSLYALAKSSCIGGVTGSGQAGTITNCKAVIDGEVNANGTIGASGSSSAMAGGIGGSLFGSVMQDCNVAVAQTGVISANGVRESSESSTSSALAGGLAASYGSDMLLQNTADVKGSIVATADNVVEAAGGVAQIRRAGYGTTGVSVDISGSVKAISKATENLASSDGAYAGGVLGECSYQTSTGATADCSANITGTIEAVHPQAAIVGGVAGSCVNPRRSFSVIGQTGKLLANEEEGTGLMSIGGVVGMVSAGTAMGCYSINKGEIKAALSSGNVTIGGVVGAAKGTTKYSRKYINACYTLQYGSMAGGEGAVVGAVAGLTGRYTTYTSSYWYDGNGSLTGHIGGSEDSTYKLADDTKATLETAATEMNTVLTENSAGSYSYSEADGWLVIEKPAE